MCRTVFAIFRDFDFREMSFKGQTICVLKASMPQTVKCDRNLEITVNSALCFVVVSGVILGDFISLGLPFDSWNFLALHGLCTIKCSCT